MLLCVLSIFATNVFDPNFNYLFDQFNSYCYNVISTKENTQQNIISENGVCNDNIQIENEQGIGCFEKINKFRLDNDCTYEQYGQNTHEAGDLLLSIPSEDNEELSQNTESLNFVDQNYLMDIDANTIIKNKVSNNPKFCNNVLNATDFLQTNVTERNLSVINNDSFSTQSNICTDSSFPKQLENIPAEQQNEFLTEQLSKGCISKHFELNNQNIDDIVIETYSFKDVDIEKYINWDPSEYDNKQNFFQEFDFVYNYNLVDSDFKQGDTDKHVDVQDKMFSEHNNVIYNEVVTNECSNANFKRTFNNDGLTTSYTKEKKLKNDDLLDKKTTKSFSADSLHVKFSNTLIENKKELCVIIDNFFSNVIQHSYIYLIYEDLTKNFIYHSIRNRILDCSRWFKKIENTADELIKNDFKSLKFSASTKNLIFDCLEFFRKIANFIINVESYLRPRQYNVGDLINNLTLIETLMNEIIIKLDFKKIEQSMQQIFFRENIIVNFSDLKAEKDILQVLFNTQTFAKKVRLYGFNITKLKEFSELNFY